MLEIAHSHVVASCDQVNKEALVITAYEPSLDVFEPDYRTKKKSMSNTNLICPICGGKKAKGKTTSSADIGSGVVVVREVKATICSQCDEEWIDDATARQERFQSMVRQHGVVATLRREKGHDIAAACGQLRLQMKLSAAVC